MKTLKILAAALFAASVLSGPIYAADEKKPCCEATVEAGKKCEHKCCVAAAEKGKLCKKCHPAEKKEKAK